MVARTLSKCEVGFKPLIRSMKGIKMFIFIKERGDSIETKCILKMEESYIEIIKHPNLEEGEVHHTSTLKNLITSSIKGKE